MFHLFLSGFIGVVVGALTDWSWGIVAFVIYWLVYLMAKGVGSCNGDSFDFFGDFGGDD